MRNPALRLVGIAASPGGGGVFGTRAEEELRLWLESRLDALGIDPVAYSRFVLSLLRRPDSALSPLDDDIDRGRRNRARPRTRLQGDREQRRAVVQCLTNAADQKYGVESLVDELCAKLRDLEGGNSNENNDECREIHEEDVKQTTLEVLTPRDRALRYYAAFPALQPATPKKTPHRKDKNSAATNISNNNNNNNSNNNNNKNIRSIGVNSNKKNNISSTHNSKSRYKKSKMSIQTIDSRRTEDKETFSFAKSMEREREKEREMELDQLRLAQLQAKFDESLEALWDSGPGSAHDKSSIWAAPSLSIPSGPLWPVDTGAVPLILPINDTTVSSTNTPYQDSIVDDSPIIPWDVDLIGVGKYMEEGSSKEKIDYNLNWSDYVNEGPWNWKDLGNNLINMDKNSPKKNSNSCFFPVTPRKSPITINNSSNNNNNNNNNNSSKETNPQSKVNSLQDADEDLLTSARTHFRPIKDDGHWADGTTFPVNNNIEKVAYRRSESGHLLYLPDEDDECPYMKYRESTTPSPLVTSQAFTLKFRVRQCDVAVQTDPIRSPIKRRILAEADHFYYSSIDDPEDYIFTPESDEIDKDSFTIGQLGWIQPSVSLLNDRKRRHSSSFNCRPLAALRPLTL